MPTGKYKRRPAPERFWAKVKKTDTCWIWTGARGSHGYGNFCHETVNGKRKFKRAHRWSYEQLVGEIPEGLELDHTCEVLLCVNPDHLEPVTGKQNVNRASRHNASNAHCPSGHSYSAENTSLSLNGNGKRSRRCKQCWRERAARQRALKRG